MERMKMRDSAKGEICSCGCLGSKLRIGGVMVTECYDRNGDLKWIDRSHNIFVTAGLNYVLDIVFDEGTADQLYVGLKDTGTPAAGDTMGSHASWATITPYSDATDPSYVAGAAAAGSIDNSASKAAFAINATDDVYGAFLKTDNTKGGTAGTLICVVDFSAQRSVVSGDTLNVTYTCTAADDGA